MKGTWRGIAAVGLVLLLGAQIAFGAASYPTTVKSFTTKATGDVIQAAHINDLQDEVAAVETGLLSGFQHHLRPLSSVLQDLGIASALWRDLNLGRTINLTQGAITTSTPFLSGTATWNSGAVTFVGASFNITDTASAVDSLFLRLQKGGVDAFLVRKDGQLSLSGSIAFLADNTVDIGATASARPRDIYVGTSVRIGTTVASSGAVRLANNANIAWRNVANTTDVSIRADGGDSIGLVGAVPAFYSNTDNITALGSAASRFTDLFLSSSVRLGANTALAGAVRLVNNASVAWRNAANTADHFLHLNTSDFLQTTVAIQLPGNPTAVLQATPKQYVDAATNSVTRTADTAGIGTTETVLDTMTVVLPAGATQLIAGASYTSEAITSAHYTSLRLYVGGTVRASVRPFESAGGLNAMHVSALVTGLSAGGTITVEVRGIASADTSIFRATAADPSHLWATSLR